jgi:redox-sensitive bicupin YhaK (pirin superfamily)
LISARAHSIGAFSVGRVLPAESCKLVGPFVFFDHMGPAVLPQGKGVDVRPHPHVNLGTVTYLFDGEIDHRDSLGFHQTIFPGAINWMTAGRGIVHSERSRAEDQARESKLHGIQLWFALPTEHEEIEPSFVHHPADTIPSTNVGEVAVRVLAGEAFGLASPVEVLHPMVYAELIAPAGSEITIDADYDERAVYVVSGRVAIGPQSIEARTMAVLRTAQPAPLRATSDARIMLIGGAPMDGPRYKDWNFVSSSKERIDRAKADWREGRFPKVPGDEEEFIPLPE